MGFRGNLDRLLEICGLNEEVAAELLLGLCERAVGGGNFSVAYPHRGRRPRGLKAVVSEEPAGFLHFLGEGEVLAMDLLRLSFRPIQCDRLVLIDQA
jgi:hypothetical protein